MRNKIKNNLYKLKTTWEKEFLISEKDSHNIAFNITEINDHFSTHQEIINNRIIKGTRKKDIKLFYKGLGGYVAWSEQIIYELKETKNILGKIKIKVRKKAFKDDDV